MQTNKSAQSGRRLGLGLILLAALLWGTVGVFVQTIYQMTAANPLSVGFFRLALATPVLIWAGWHQLGWQMWRIERRDFGVLLLIGAMTALYQVCYFGAIAQIGVAAATLITLCTAPLWVAGFAVGWLGEKLTRRLALSGACAVVGTALLVGVQPAGLGSGHWGWGILLATGSAIGYALVTLGSRRVAQRYHPLQCAAIGFGIGALILLPWAIYAGLVVRYPAAGWLCLLYLGVVPTAFAYWLYFIGMRHTPATIASIATLLEPLTATILAGILFQERLGIGGLFGAGLLMAAIGLLYQESHADARS
jgi:drug/metabolite transporter, DME family